MNARKLLQKPLPVRIFYLLIILVIACYIVLMIQAERSMNKSKTKVESFVNSFMTCLMEKDTSICRDKFMLPKSKYQLQGVREKYVKTLLEHFGKRIISEPKEDSWGYFKPKGFFNRDQIIYLTIGSNFEREIINEHFAIAKLGDSLKIESFHFDDKR